MTPHNGLMETSYGHGHHCVEFLKDVFGWHLTPEQTQRYRDALDGADDHWLRGLTLWLMFRAEARGEPLPQPSAASG